MPSAREQKKWCVSDIQQGVQQHSIVIMYYMYYIIVCPNSSAICAIASLPRTSATTAQFLDSMQYSVLTSRQPNDWSMSN